MKRAAQTISFFFVALLLLVASPSSAIIFFDVDGDMVRLGGGGGGGNSWTFVQGQTDANNGTSVTSTAISTTTGNLIVVLAGSAGQAFTGSPVTDSGGHTWTPCPGQVNFPGSGTRVIQYYSANITGSASHTFTAATSVSDDLTIVVYEFTDTTTSVCDQSAGGGHDTEVTSHTSATTGTTTAAAELLVGGMATGDTFGATVTGTNGWTVSNYNNGGGTDVAGAYRVVSSTGTYNYTATSATAARSSMSIGTYK